MKLRLEQELKRVEDWIRSHSYFNHNGRRDPINSTEEKLNIYIERRKDLDYKLSRIQNINPLLPDRKDLVEIAIKRVAHRKLVVEKLNLYKADRKEKIFQSVVFKEHNESLYKRRVETDGAIIATLYEIPDDGIRYDIKRRIEVCIVEGKIKESDVNTSFNSRSGSGVYKERILKILRDKNLLILPKVFDRDYYLKLILEAYKTPRPTLELENILKKMLEIGLDNDEIKLLKSEAMKIRRSLKNEENKCL